MRRIGLAWLVGCYSPHVDSGSPCDPGPCPAGQTCSSHTCVSGDAGVDAGGGWLTGYAHRKRITVTPEIDEALVDFPLSVVTDDPDLAAGALADGTDIVFTADDGVTLLDAERVAYDPSTGALEAWVRISIATHAPTALFMYYGGPPGAAPQTVWPASLAGVWHLTTGSDSTGHGYTASAPTAAEQPAPAAGIVGAAMSYDGVDDRLVVGDPSDGSLDFGTRSFSYSVWVDVTTSVGMYDLPFHKGGSSLSEPGYDLELGTGPWHACLSDGVTVSCGTFGDEAAFLGRWVHLTGVVDRGAGKLNVFADRALAESHDISSLGSIDTTFPLSFGVPSDVFHGLLDEVRISTVPLSASWIAAEYDNAMSRDAFIAIGPAESP